MVFDLTYVPGRYLGAMLCGNLIFNNNIYTCRILFALFTLISKHVLL